MRFLLVTSKSRRMFDGGRSFAIRFIENPGPAASVRLRTMPEPEKARDSTLSRRGLRAARRRSQCLSHADRRDLQGFSVLGDRAARDHDALLPKDLGHLAV